MHDDYTLAELRELDEQFEGRLCSDLKFLYGLDLYKAVNEGGRKEAELSFWVNAAFKRLLSNPESHFKAHLEYMVLNEPEQVGGKEKRAREKAEKFKPQGTLYWGTLNEQVFELTNSLNIGIARLLSVQGVSKLPELELALNPKVPSKESKAEAMFVPASRGPVDDSDYDWEKDPTYNRD